MRKDDKEAIISWVGVGILGAVLIYIVQGECAIWFLFTFPIITFLLLCIARARTRKLSVPKDAEK